MKTCADVMTTDVVCCVLTDTVKAVAQKMKTEDIGAVPIVENEHSKKLIGIVTDRDLVLNVLAEGYDGKETTIESIMARRAPVTCRPHDHLDNAMQAMARHQVRRIPIINDQDEVIGIIAQADIAIRIDQPQKTAEVVEEISKPDGDMNS